MNDKELFITVFNRLAEQYRGLKLSGTLVYYNGTCRFNIDGFNLCYNLLRLTRVIEEAGELR